MNMVLLLALLATPICAMAERPVRDPFSVCTIPVVIKQIKDGDIKKPTGWHSLLELGCSEKQAKAVWAEILLNGKLK